MSGSAEAFEVIAKGRTTRHRARRDAPSHLPELRPRQRIWLLAWARPHQLTRTRDALYKAQADIALEEADALVDLLLRTGWVSLRETLQRGVWLWQSLQWRDLPALQQQLGLPTAQALANDQADWQGAMDAWLLALPEHHPLRVGLLEALADLSTGRTPYRRKQERGALLRSACAWFDEGRTGHRRDFALWARNDTKSITDTEWDWLDQHLGLADLQIQTFTPMLWLAGPLHLQWGHRALDLGLLDHQAIPIHQLLSTSAIQCDRQPTYWLIENRTSFERQARLHHDKVLIWMPGRPTHAWLNAMGHLLDQAPGPALISADLDPSGLVIVMAACQPWSRRQLPWQMQDMSIPQLQAARHWPLGSHDHLLLDTLLTALDTPADVQVLAQAMRDSGRKAEQEGWL